MLLVFKIQMMIMPKLKLLIFQHLNNLRAKHKYELNEFILSSGKRF